MNDSYTAALFYDSLGWKLVKIPPKTKNPIHQGWNKTPTPPDWWEKNPDSSMGLLLGLSKVISFDIDHQEYTRLIFYNFGLDYDKILDKCPRIVGRPGHDKALFLAPDNIELKTKKLSWDDTTIFEFRAGAVQDVLPPSIHPDTGLPYTWRRDPSDGIPTLPKELLAIWSEWDKFLPQLLSICPWALQREIPPLKPKRQYKDSPEIIEKYNAATDITILLERYGYIKKSSGRYLRPGSTTGIPGVVVFPKENRIFSHHGGEPFDTQYSHDAFDLFCTFEHNGNIAAAITDAKTELNLQAVEYDDEAIRHGQTVAETFLKKTSASISKSGPDLLSVPGILQLAVEYYQATALKPQPEYAVAAALAIGATCLSRQWRTNQNNYSALYFLMLGKSSTGKEHGKTVIETVLRESGEECLKLIGPPGYTSAGGIITTLKIKPRHICIQDEMGKQLQHAMASRNSQKDAAYTMLMEIFGRQSGFISSDAYSDLSGRHRNEPTTITIERPGITIFGISTPSTLYKAIDTDSISSGYLPRFLIIESTAERKLSRWIDNFAEVPEKLKTWCLTCAIGTGDTGNLSAYTNPPESKTVKFHSNCKEMLEKFEKEIIKIQNGLDAFGIAELWGRVKEISMRISLIVAVSCESDIILPEHLNWSMQYVKKHFENTTSRIRMIVSNSDYEAVCKDILSIIKKSGIRGATRREIYKRSALARALDDKAFTGVLATLESNEGILLSNISHAGGGRPRQAWMYPEDAEIIME